MSKSPSPLSLREMLRYCCEPSSPYWNYAWNEFNKRYKQYIYGSVKRCCYAWQAPHVKKQLSEVVNDIVEIIFEKLCVDDYKVLRGFEGEDNESMFHSWLATICYRTSNRYLRQKWFDTVLDERAMAGGESAYSANSEFIREIYETVVRLLRTLPKRKTDVRERDINIFLLYTFAGFSDSMLRASGCLHALGYRVVDVVIHRLRKELAPYRDYF
ncbi:sigma-70 family RNA polymerase sigma factor [candidate division KSB1 bacterium]|nr:sigma-70 family RNA polymerase sigma factor [candidate division KSB1 bacterium]